MSDEKITSFIANFYCSKDSDIEDFLKLKAIDFEKLGKSRTFIVFDEEAESISSAILGYFTLAISILEVPDELSNRKRKDLDGLSAKKHSEVIGKFPAILIGQLAKNDIANKLFTGDCLMAMCLSKVLEGQKILGGRIIMLECKNENKLLEFYSRYGFNLISDKAKDNSLLVLNRVLYESEISYKK